MVYLSTGGSFNTLDPGEYDNSLAKFFEIYTLRDFTPADETLFLYRPFAKNRRMIAQRGQFVWCRGIGKSLKATDLQIEIPCESKNEIALAIARLGYTREALLPPGLASDFDVP